MRWPVGGQCLEQHCFLSEGFQWSLRVMGVWEFESGWACDNLIELMDYELK